MLHKYHLIVFAIALLIVPSCLYAAMEIPFEGDTVLAQTFAPTNDGCPQDTVRFNVSGAGKFSLTHFGAAAVLTQFVCLNPTTLEYTVPMAIIAAANGDVVYLTASGHGVPISQTQFTIQGHFDLNGGTGRFAHATGSGIVSGTVDMVTGLAPHHLEGWISSVGSGMRE